jgi:hypothetical protein
VYHTCPARQNDFGTQKDAERSSLQKSLGNNFFCLFQYNGKPKNRKSVLWSRSAYVKVLKS